MFNSDRMKRPSSIAWRFLFRTACAIISLIPLSTLSAAGSHEAGGSKYVDALRAHKTEIARGCGLAMSNMMCELEKLATQYPPLSDIGSIKICKGRLSDSGDNYLHYSKNSSYVVFPFPPFTRPPQPPGKYVFGKDGADLTIWIVNTADPSIPKAAGSFYPLIKDGNVANLYVAYDLHLSSPNAALEGAVKSIVEKQVESLRSEFRSILRACT